MAVTRKTRDLVRLALDPGASVDEARTAALLALRRLAEEGGIAALAVKKKSEPVRAERPWSDGVWPIGWCSAVEGASLGSSFRLCDRAGLMRDPSVGPDLCAEHIRYHTWLVHTIDWRAVDCPGCEHLWTAEPGAVLKFEWLARTLGTHAACRRILRLWPAACREVPYYARRSTVG